MALDLPEPIEGRGAESHPKPEVLAKSHSFEWQHTSTHPEQKNTYITSEEKDSAGILGGAAMGGEDRTLPEV